MSKPVAKEGDQVVGLDTHVIMVPSPGGAVPTPTPHPFSGILQEQLSSSVFVANMAVAVVGSVANNLPPHIPMGGPFQKPPSNKASVSRGSDTVFVDGQRSRGLVIQPAVATTQPTRTRVRSSPPEPCSRADRSHPLLLLGSLPQPP